MSFRKKTVHVLEAALVMFWIMLISFACVLLSPIAHFIAEDTVDTLHSQLSHDYLVQIADDTRAYTTGYNIELPLGADERVAFTPQVIQHLDDVRSVFVACNWAAGIVTGAFAMYIIWLMRKNQAHLLQPRIRLARSLSRGSLAALVVTLLVGIFGLTSFDALFTSMHRIFFAEGSWMFSFDSLLICALPEPFWVACAIAWVFILVLICAIVLLASYWLNSAQRSEKESRPALSRRAH